MVLGKITFNSDGAKFGNQLSTGLNVKDIKRVENSARGLVKASVKLLPNATPEQMLQTAMFAQQDEDANEILALQSQQQIRRLKAGLRRLQIATNHASQTMGVEEQWMQTQQQHASRILRHGLTTGITQAESIGTQQAYRVSSFDSM